MPFLDHSALLLCPTTRTFAFSVCTRLQKKGVPGFCVCYLVLFPGIVSKASRTQTSLGCLVTWTNTGMLPSCFHSCSLSRVPEYLLFDFCRRDLFSEFGPTWSTDGRILELFVCTFPFSHSLPEFDPGLEPQSPRSNKVGKRGRPAESLRGVTMLNHHNALMAFPSLWMNAEILSRQRTASTVRQVMRGAWRGR